MENNINKEDNLSSFDLEGFAAKSTNDDDVRKETLPSRRSEMAERNNTPELYDEVKDIVDTLISCHIDITTPYKKWIHLGFALANGLGENGRDLYHRLSSMNAQYNPTECDKKYTSCMKGDGQGITIKTFFKMAMDVGVTVSATCAKVPSAKNIENIGKSTILGSFGNEMAHGALAQVALPSSIGNAPKGSGYTFSDKIKMEDWPSILQSIYKLYPDAVSRDKMLLGCIDSCSGIMGGANGTTDAPSGIYGIYDGHRVYAPLFTLLSGSAASKKGDLLYCKMLVRPVKLEMRREYEAAKAEYEKELAAYEAQGKGKNKGERGEAPKEPAFRDPFVSGNSSASAAYRSLEANDGWGMMFETEADTISNMMGSDYGDYSDVLRKVYHHETISMSRVSEKLHIDIENPRLSVFITCTPGQIPSLFPSFENGLGSRFQFYLLPDETVEFHDVFAHSDNTLEETFKQMGEELLPLYHALKARKGNPIQFVLSTAQQAEFLSTYKEVLIDQFQMLGAGFNAFVYRTALANFRYAMVLTALRHLSEWNKKDDLFPDDERALVCDDRDFHIAMQIMGCLINHTARVYAVLAKENENPFAQHGIKLSKDELNVYQSIPEGEFRTADFIALAEQKGFSKRTAQRMLGQMSNVYRIITPLRRGVYCKAISKEE